AFFLTFKGLSCCWRSRALTASASSASIVPLRSSPVRERASQTNSAIGALGGAGRSNDEWTPAVLSIAARQPSGQKGPAALRQGDRRCLTDPYRHGSPSWRARWSEMPWHRRPPWLWPLGGGGGRCRAPPPIARVAAARV